MPGLRRCRWCKRPTTNDTADATNTPRLRQAHCPNPQCDWCLPCVTRREAAIRAGRQDLLEPVTPPEPETAGEQTREIPAVQDDIPPDQMT